MSYEIMPVYWSARKRKSVLNQKPIEKKTALFSNVKTLSLDESRSKDWLLEKQRYSDYEAEKLQKKGLTKVKLVYSIWDL